MERRRKKEERKKRQKKDRKEGRHDFTAKLRVEYVC